MASQAHVIVVGARDGLIGDARTQLDYLEQRWSRFLPDSDITRINTAGGEPVEVTGDTLTLFAAMVDGWHLTDGRFDPTVLPAVIANGYSASTVDRIGSRSSRRGPLGRRRGQR